MVRARADARDTFTRTDWLIMIKPEALVKQVAIADLCPVQTQVLLRLLCTVTEWQ